MNAADRERALQLVVMASRQIGDTDVVLVCEYLRVVNESLGKAIDALRNERNTAQRELADERAAHAVTRAERNVARRDMVAAMRAVCEDKTPSVQEAELRARRYDSGSDVCEAIRRESQASAVGPDEEQAYGFREGWDAAMAYVFG